MNHYFEKVFDVFNYPAGEPHVRLSINPISPNDTVIAENVRDFNDLLILMTAERILRRNGILVKWVVPYFPFARHDRRIDSFDGEELVFALEMGKTLGIVTVDPHSDVTGQLPHYTQADVVKQYKRQGLFHNEPIVAIPDAGAIKKVNSWIDLVPNNGTIQCLKTRDSKTGQLSGFEVLSSYLDGFPVTIVDDICDGGGTFIGLANELRAMGAGELRLAVTHGLFTKGLDGLFGWFDKIYTLDTYKYMHRGLTQVPVYELLKGEPV